MNAYRMYCVLYEEERELKKPGLPMKWSHMGFLEELVYDLLLPKETKRHVNMLKAEESLFAASKLVDQEKTAAARSELENAQTLIRNLRPQAEAK